MKPWRAALTSATASGKSTRIASRRAIACSSEPPSTRTWPSAAAVSSTAVFSVSVANCSRCASCTDSACCSANSRSPRISSSGSPPSGNPNPPSTPDTLAARRRTLPETPHPFLQPRAAVEREHLAGDEAGVVGDEEGAGVRDLVLAPEAAERDLREHRGAHLLRRPEPLPRLRRVDRAGRERVHANPVRRPFDRQRPCEVDDARLRGRRVDGPRPAGPGVRRDDVDDLAASAALDCPPPELAGAEERAVEDYPENGAPGVRREVLGPDEEVARRVVHERRHRPELLLGGVERGRDRLRVAHVTLDGEPVAELARHLLERLAPPAGDGDAGAEPPELERHRAPEPRAAAGDERDAAAERPLREHQPPGGIRHTSAPPRSAKLRTRTSGVPGRGGTSAPCSSTPPRSAKAQIVTTSESISAWRRSRSEPPNSVRTNDRRGTRHRPLRSTPPKIETVKRFGDRRARGAASAGSSRSACSSSPAVRARYASSRRCESSSSVSRPSAQCSRSASAACSRCASETRSSSSSLTRAPACTGPRPRPRAPRPRRDLPSARPRTARRRRYRASPRAGAWPRRRRPGSSASRAAAARPAPARARAPRPPPRRSRAGSRSAAA